MIIKRSISFLFLCFVLFPALSYSEILPLESPPHNFSSISGEIQAIPLKWSMHSNTKVLGYVIYRSDSKGSDFTEIAKLPSRYVTSHLDGREAARITFKILSKMKKSLSDNKNYYYKIATITGKNSLGEFSAAIKATTAPRPSSPLNFKAYSGGANIISLNWLPPNDKTVSGYRIYRKNSLDGELKAIKDISGRIALSYIDKGKFKNHLESGKEYYYAISSLNQADVESYITKIASAKTKTPPPPVKGISASKNNVKSIEITWEPSPIPDLKNYVILKKRIDSSESKKEIKIPEDKVSYVDDNLPDGARYHYQVKAVDIDELEGNLSLAASGITKSVPATPKNLKIYIHEKKIIVEWDKNPEPDIVKYKVYKITGLLGIMKTLGISKSNTFVDTSFKKGSKVSYRIVAINKDNLMSQKSDIISIRIPK